ncbi:hypothetical protein ACJMK2_007535 [Sinanodonta woodiana]|uniref:Translocation protein SEC62 n=1 Tax=Sinanodonta woodiana TaxID=1069815 RepID=A0ABD3VLB4_SINWO
MDGIDNMNLTQSVKNQQERENKDKSAKPHSKESLNAKTEIASFKACLCPHHRSLLENEEIAKNSKDQKTQNGEEKDGKTDEKSKEKEIEKENQAKMEAALKMIKYMDQNKRVPSSGKCKDSKRGFLHVNMAERRKPRRKNDTEEKTAVSKEEYAVAKHMRFNIMVHEGRLAGMSVKCFLASDAIDCLMESKWAKGKSADPNGEIFFKDRLSCQHFCQRLLEKGLFHRADKKERSKEERSKDREKSKKKKRDTTESTEGKKDTKKEKKSKKDTDKEVEKTDENKEEKKEEKKEGDKKSPKPKRYKLTMSEDQRFVDGNNVYVWIYDPIHPKTFSIGLLMVLGAVALCLFPLWPDWMRIGVYYLSILGATFVGLTLFLIVLRVILFAFVWLVTLGTHHLWIFPNLTEDVGILESFRPLYMHEKYVAPKKDQKEKEEENENVSLELDQKKDSEESGSEGNDKNGFEMVETYDVEKDNMDEMVDDNADENKDEENSNGDESDIEDEDKKRK